MVTRDQPAQRAGPIYSTRPPASGLYVLYDSCSTAPFAVLMRAGGPLGGHLGSPRSARLARGGPRLGGDEASALDQADDVLAVVDHPLVAVRPDGVIVLQPAHLAQDDLLPKLAAQARPVRALAAMSGTSEEVQVRQ